MVYNKSMKTFLIRPEYLENLHNLCGKKLISKTMPGKTAYIRSILHCEPWGDDPRKGDLFNIIVDGEWFITYDGNEGYHKFLKEWGVEE